MNLSVNLPAIVAALVLLVLLVGLLAYSARAARPVAVPVGPAVPVTGQIAMERKVAISIAMIIGTGVLLLAYGLKEPARQDEASERQQNASIGRGITTYTTLCFGCHGEKGQSAIETGVTPERVSPVLDRPDLRPDPNSDPDAFKKTQDMLTKTIARGRPGTPMPAWGQTDGGSLSDEQINELVLMIMNGATPVEFEGSVATPWQHANDVVMAEVAQGVAQLPAQPQVQNQPFYQALNPEQQQGVQVIMQRGCGGCHTIPNIPGAAGNIGPNLGPTGPGGPIPQRKTIAGGAVPNNSVDDLARWIQNPQALKPGTAMPTLGLSEAEAHAAASYLYTLTS